MPIRRLATTRELSLINSGMIWYAHFGIECRSWGSLNVFNKGTRTSLNPYGAGSLEREVVGNLQLTNMMILVRALLAAGRLFSIENPFRSHLWQTKEMLWLAEQADVFFVRFDQCEFGLRPPDYDGFEDVRTKKDTLVLTNVPRLRVLQRRCQKNHQHVHAFGVAKTRNGCVHRSKAAGVYPQDLCIIWARAVRRSIVKAIHSIQLS